MKVIVYSRPEGHLSVVYPAHGARRVSGAKRDGQTIWLTSPATLDQLEQLLIEGFEPVFAEREDEFVQRVAEQTCPVGAQTVLLDPVSLPSDRTFRNAWRFVDGTVQIDLDCARGVCLARLRRARNDLLGATDRLAQRAMEQADEQAIAEITSLRQRLRDMPSDIGATIRCAESPEELKELWPDSMSEAKRLVKFQGEGCADFPMGIYST